MSAKVLRTWLLLLVAFLFALGKLEQPLIGQTKTANVTNVVLITLDGLRAEEVFRGADQRLMIKENGVQNPEDLRRGIGGTMKQVVERHFCRFYGNNAVAAKDG